MRYRSITLRRCFHFLGCLLAVALTACDGHDLPDDGAHTATLRFSVPLPGTATRADGTVAEEDKIHSLRVIVTGDGGKTYINQKFENPGSTLTINEVPVGTVHVYAIANEAALDLNYDSYTYEDWVKDLTFIDGHGSKLIVMDEGRTHFPLRANDTGQDGIPLIQAYGLPMSWDDEVTVTGDEQTVNVELTRCVSRLTIKMENHSKGSITVRGLDFGPFFSDRLCVFAESKLDVPGDTEYAPCAYPKDEISNDNSLNIEIAKDASKELVFYIYPSAAWKSTDTQSPYTLGFTTARGRYDRRPFVHNSPNGDSSGMRYSDIGRNKKVTITAKLNGAGNVKFNFQAVEWDEYTVNVPDFN